MVYPALLPLMRTPRLPVVDWTDAPSADLNGLVRFARKTKSGFCACAITFQLASPCLQCTCLLQYNDASSKASLCSVHTVTFVRYCYHYVWSPQLLDSSWNVVANGDAREGKWRGNWRMQWVACTLHTTSEHGISSITTADAHTSAASSRLNWRPPADLNGLVRFAERRNLVSARVSSHFNWPLPSVDPTGWFRRKVQYFGR